VFRHPDDSALELKYALFRRSGNLLLFELKVPKHRGAEKSRIRLGLDRCLQNGLLVDSDSVVAVIEKFIPEL
jgi:hypothetical protein